MTKKNITTYDNHKEVRYLVQSAVSIVKAVCFNNLHTRFCAKELQICISESKR